MTTPCFRKDERKPQRQRQMAQKHLQIATKAPHNPDSCHNQDDSCQLSPVSCQKTAADVRQLPLTWHKLAISPLAARPRPIRKNSVHSMYSVYSVVKSLCASVVNRYQC